MRKWAGGLKMASSQLASRAKLCHYWGMKILLLLLLLTGSTTVTANEVSGRSAYMEYLLHVDKAREFILLENIKMACSEMRSASIILIIEFNNLQYYKPEINWLQSKIKNQKFLDDLCTPYGDGTSIMSILPIQNTSLPPASMSHLSRTHS